MRERQIHPAVFIEIERSDSRRRSRHFGRPRGDRRKAPSRWLIKIAGDFCQPETTRSTARSLFTSTASRTNGRRCRQGPFLRPIHKRAVAFIAPKNVAGGRRILREAKGCRDSPAENRQIASHRDPDRRPDRSRRRSAQHEPVAVNSGAAGHVLERAVAFVVVKADAALEPMARSGCPSLS